MIILASTSEIRKKILEEFNLDFEVCAPNFDEEKAKLENPNLSIQDLAMFLAKNKALSISSKFKDCLIIGSDQICEIDGMKFDKSVDFQSAFEQLKILNGKTHFQNNAVAIVKNGEVIFQKIDKAELEMKKFSDDEIIDYINKDKPFGSAGSYKFEENGKNLFANINGNYYSILGLNIKDILDFLKNNNYF